MMMMFRVMTVVVPLLFVTFSFFSSSGEVAAGAGAAAAAASPPPQTFAESSHFMPALSQSARVSGCDSAKALSAAGNGEGQSESNDRRSHRNTPRVDETFTKYRTPTVAHSIRIAAFGG
jgi:hypothetical protein